LRSEKKVDLGFIVLETAGGSATGEVEGHGRITLEIILFKD
jgi:hypothetical protein